MHSGIGAFICALIIKLKTLLTPNGSRLNSHKLGPDSEDLFDDFTTRKEGKIALGAS